MKSTKPVFRHRSIIAALRNDIRVLKDSFKEVDGVVRDPKILLEMDLHREAIQIIKQAARRAA